MIKILIPATSLFILFFSACATAPIGSEQSSYTRLLEKNYALSVPMECYVGEKMISVKDYWARSITRNDAVKSDRAFRIQYYSYGSKRNESEHEEGKVFKITAVKSIDGSDHRIIDAHVAIDNSGRIRRDRLYNDTFRGPVAQALSSVSVEPSDVILSPYSYVEINKTKGFTNFEIIYTGKSGNSLNLVYREFTPDDMAKTAFYQNLTYDITADSVRFRNLLIKIGEKTNEKISYTVINDI
jgi:hypothetical protein